jgi:hypothetical protein
LVVEEVYFAPRAYWWTKVPLVCVHSGVDGLKVLSVTAILISVLVIDNVDAVTVGK